MELAIWVAGMKKKREKKYKILEIMKKTLSTDTI